MEFGFCKVKAAAMHKGLQLFLYEYILLDLRAIYMPLRITITYWESTESHLVTSSSAHSNLNLALLTPQIRHGIKMLGRATKI